MNRYRITYGYRTDDGMGLCVSTHTNTVELEAEDAKAAREKAIDEAYRLHGEPGGVCSHVTIRHVELTATQFS